MDWQHSARRLIKAAAMSLWESTNGTYHHFAVLPQAGFLRPISSDFGVSGPAENSPNEDLLTVPSEIANARQHHSTSSGHNRVAW